MISLYPCANLECEYPVGHAEFIDQPGTTGITRYYGFVKCKILPPYELYHPVLLIIIIITTTNKTTTHNQQKKRKVFPFL